MVFRLLVTLVIVGYLAHRAYYIRTVRHASDAVVRQPPDPAEPVVRYFLIPAMVLTALYVVAPAWMRWASIPLPAGLRWAGLGLALGGYVLLQWAQSALGRSWSPQPQLLTDHRLVADGPYRWVRHPMYSAVLLAHASVLLLSANWCVGGIWLATSAWQFLARMPIEEALMVDRFGEEYRGYMRTTGRLFPRILRRV